MLYLCSHNLRIAMASTGAFIKPAGPGNLPNDNTMSGPFGELFTRFLFPRILRFDSKNSNVFVNSNTQLVTHLVNRLESQKLLHSAHIGHWSEGHRLFIAKKQLRRSGF